MSATLTDNDCLKWSLYAIKRDSFHSYRHIVSPNHHILLLYSAFNFFLNDEKYSSDVLFAFISLMMKRKRLFMKSLNIFLMAIHILNAQYFNDWILYDSSNYVSFYILFLLSFKTLFNSSSWFLWILSLRLSKLGSARSFHLTSPLLLLSVEISFRQFEFFALVVYLFTFFFVKT